MKVPFALPDIGNQEIAAAVKALKSGWMSTGPESRAFEKEFAQFINQGGSENQPLHALAVNSATSGLHLALEAAGVGPGDEVIVPTWTFTASAEVVRYLGATPIIVDVDAETLNITAEQVERAISPRTRVVMPVHFAGLAVEMDPIRSLAQQRGLKVIEDAAHALPAIDRQGLVGASDSFATVFSFYATKTITTGEGGMVTSRNPDALARMQVMRLHGIDRDAFARYNSDKPAWHYEVIAPGFKYNMTDFAAAIGRVQLQRANELRKRRVAIAQYYLTELVSLPLALPVDSRDSDGHAWHLFVIRLSEDARISRDCFINRMAENGIGCSVHFIPLHFHPYWRDTFGLLPQDFPVASTQFARAVSLPIYPSMSDSQVEYVVETVRMLLM